MLMNGSRFYASQGMFLEAIDGGVPIQNSGASFSQKFEYFGVPVPNPLADRFRQQYNNVCSFDSRDDLASSADGLSVRY
jgi:hypothetical protein